MQTTSGNSGFARMNRAYNATFRPGRLSIGLILPLESYLTDEIPTMERHIERVQMAEKLGFAAIWLRDVPFNVPAFGDVGQMFDPFVYLGALAACTTTIALGTASIILPLRHPAHVAKAAASVDILSGGRMLLGVASGDRAEEYPALNMNYEQRGTRFRASMEYIRATAESFPQFQGHHGTLNRHLDMLPKPASGKMPLLITGGSQQSPEWVSAHGDGWITYPRNREPQAQLIAEYRRQVLNAGGPDKPVVQSLYVDLLEKADAPTRPLALGFQAGSTFLLEYLHEIQSIGVNHVALNLRHNFEDIEPTLERIANELLPEFAG